MDGMMKNDFTYDSDKSEEEQIACIQQIVDTIKIDTEQGFIMMYTYLKKYINSYLTTSKYSSYINANNRADIEQSIVTEIFSHLKEYDLSKGKPSTFFTPYIVGALNEEVRSGISIHYNRYITQMRQIDSERRKKGLQTTLDDYYVLMSEVSPVTIKEAFDQMTSFSNPANYDPTGEDRSLVSQTDIFKTPEKQYEKREEEEELYKALNQLEPLEKQVVILKYKLYTSKPELLTYILREVTEWRPIDILRANGYSTFTALKKLGLSSEEIFLLYGLKKKEITNALEKGVDDELKEYLHSKKARTVIETNLIGTNMLKILETNGRNVVEIQDILSGKNMDMTELKSVNELNVRDLLHGKGMLKSEISAILENGDDISNNKISNLLNIEKREVRALQAKAISKLTRILGGHKLFAAKETEMMDKMLNIDPLLCTDDKKDFVESFYDDLDFVDDDLFASEN